MATQAQIEASRINGAKSKGPKTAQGKDVSKFNGLKHGLRAQDVVLPNEDPAAFQEHLDAWMADWQPPTMARAALVEQAASAAWRSRRCIRVETARVSARMRDAYADYDRREAKAVDRLLDRLRGDAPREALGALLGSAAGIDRLIAHWADLEDAAADPAGWDDFDDHHILFLKLTGHCAGDPEVAKPKEYSYRLYLRNAPEDMVDDDDPAPWDDEEAAHFSEQVRMICRAHRLQLETMRCELPDPAAARDAHAERVAFEPQPGDAALLRYEGQLNRQFHKALDGLMKLVKTGADLAELEPDAPSEPEPVPAPTEPKPAAPSEPEASARPAPPAPSEPKVQSPPTSPAPSEPEADAPPAPLTRSDRDRGGRTWAVEASPDA